MKKGRITLILLLMLIMTIVRNSSSPMVSKTVRSIKGTTDYELHDPIEILNDNDFASYAFEGFGTPDEPYLIDSYFISDSTRDLIRIENTAVYFKISNCYLNALGSNFRGIVLVNVNHAIIDSNIICNPNNGIVLALSNHITLTGNTIYNCANDGISLSPSSNNNALSDNTIYNCLGDGISLYWSSSYNMLSNNTIYSCSEDGILLWDSNNYNTFSSNTIYNCSENGIVFDTNNNYNTLSSNTIYNCAKTGIGLGWSNHSTLSNNTIYGCNGGISLGSSSHGTLSNNMVYNVRVGISVGGSYWTLSNNTVYNCTYGISLSGSNNCLSNNTVYTCSYTLLHLAFSNHSILSSNTFYDSSYRGIVLQDSSSYNTLSNNTISHCFDDGIYLYESSSYNTLSSNTIDNCSKNGLSLMYPNYYNTLSYNTISNCSDNGIALGGSNHSTLFSNLISQCSDNGIYLSDSNHNTLSSNMIYNCSIIGIHLASYNHYNTLSSNMISNCSNDGIYLYSLSEDNILSYNTISHCSDNGIELVVSDYNTLSYNTISNCSDNGIELAASDYNSLSYNTIYNNSNYGFYFGPQDFSNENMANWNNFLDNNVGGTSQAYDTGTANNIGYNHWDEWLSPDIEPDGIVDLPYSIDGDAINTDPSPLTTPKPPLVNIVTPFDQGYSTDTITVILSGNAIQYWYYIEGEDTENQTWRAMEERTLNDGTYTLHAYGKILNTISLVSVVFTIDTTPPTFNIVSPTSITYTMGTIIVDLSGDTDVAYYWYFIEGFSVDNKLWTQNIDETLDDGAYILHAYANDTTGNTAYVSVAFKIDTVAPTITLESPPHDTVHNSWTIIKVDVVDVFLDTVLYNWDGITNKTWNQDYEYWTLLPSEETQHNLYVYANDRLGRWTSEVFVFTTDDTNPVVDITSPTEITYNQNSVTLTYTVSEGIATIYINGVANTTALPSGVIIPNLQDGIYNITIMAVDSAGNIGNVTVIFVIDTAEEISSETTAETSSEPTSETTTTPQVGFFPGLLPVLLFYIIIVVFLRRHKYNS